MEDSRGAKVGELMASTELEVLNEGKTPTFYAIRGGDIYKSIVDITLCSGRIFGAISNWKVDPDLSTLSDHRAIRFDLDLQKQRNRTEPRTSTRIYNTAKAKWNLFPKSFRDELEKRGITCEKIRGIANEDALESLIREYVDCISLACEEMIPKISKQVKPGKTEWWTEELTSKKKCMIRLRNRIIKANPRRRQLVIQEYLETLEDYRFHVHQTITTSWKVFCTRQERENMWQSIYRITVKCLKRTDDRLLRSPLTNLILSDLLAWQPFFEANIIISVLRDSP